MAVKILANRDANLSRTINI
jgi:hypothetical protein